MSASQSAGDGLPTYDEAVAQGSGPRWVDTSREGTFDLSALKEELQAIPLAWSLELASIEARIPPSSVAGLPWYYVDVQEAGEGAFGVVLLCLPRAYVVAATYANTRGTPFTVEELRSKLVAVKVADRPSAEFDSIKSCQNEVRVQRSLLEHMQRSQNLNSLRFPLPKGNFSTADHSEQAAPVGAKYWLAMDAIVPSLTVGDVFDDDDHMHELGSLSKILLLHVFCEVMESIAVLHGCDPPIQHDDLHNGNFMLRLTTGLPEVIVVDFGKSKLISGGPDEDLEADFEDLQSTLWEMIREANVFPDYEGWDQNSNILQIWTDFANMITRQDPPFGSSMRSLLEPARTALASVRPEAIAKLAKVLRGIPAEIEGELEENFQRLGLIPGP